MNIKELFNQGVSFEKFVNTGADSYKEKTIQIYSSIQFDKDLISRIAAIDKRINVLALAEIWCPDCMVNVPVLQKIKDINDNFKISIIIREGNEKYFERYSVEGAVKIPTFIFLNKNFREVGYFIERPSIVKNIYDSDSQAEIIVATKKYRNGEYTDETARDILNILNY
ncbi:MAG: thioredoxin family protein [Tissierellia bacterium]|nr:thioredoxin family protein [Tissierellia bacterium]